MARFARLRGGGLYLPAGEAVANPPPDERILIVDTDGLVKLVDPTGAKSQLGSGADMRSIVSQTAASVLPSGFADFWTDYTGSQDHAISQSIANSVPIVTTESGGKRRLTTQATGPGLAEITPGVLIPTMINPKSSAWYVEGRAAIETHGANSVLFPCSIALTSGGTMVGPPSANTFCGLGLAGTGFTGGNNSFLSFAAASAGTMLLQTTTIPWGSAIQAYGLSFDGSGTITAWLNGSPVWTTTNLNQIVASAGGCHPHTWIYASDTTPTTMLADYLYGAGPRI